MYKNRKPIGFGCLFFVTGIFTALVCPIWLIAAIEGVIIIAFVLSCHKRF
ncbi:MAG: hypothetical protein IKU60_04750 [Clostridia bacterium]|nr:hypothetical protein [Clostridia bacterium]